MALLVLAFASPAVQADDGLILNGIATHNELRKDYFMAGLYLPTPNKKAEDIFNMTGAKRMEIRVTHDRFSPRKFANLWRDSIVINNSPEDVEKFGPDMIRFATMLKGKLVTGDQIKIELVPLNGTIVTLNGTELARFNPEFFKLLLRAWIGPRPTNSDFKRDLLANGEIADQLVAKYDSIVPLDGRKQIAAAWASGTQVASSDAAAEQARREAEERARAEAEARRKAEEEARQAAEAKAAEEARLRAEAEARAKAEAEERRKAEEEARRLAEATAAAEAKAKAEAEAAAKAAEEARLAALAAEADAKAKAEAEAAAKAAEEARLRAEAEAKARAEAEARALAAAQAEEEAKRKAEEEARKRAEAEAKAKAEAEARALAAAEAQRQAEEEERRRAEEEAARKAAAELAAAEGGDGEEEDGAVEMDAEQLSRELYQSKLVAWVYKYLEYPDKDRRRRNEGSLRATIVINREGQLQDSELTEKSRYASLNFAAKRAISTAQPYPVMPDDVSGDTFEFSVPILFRVE